MEKFEKLNNFKKHFNEFEQWFINQDKSYQTISDPWFDPRNKSFKQLLPMFQYQLIQKWLMEEKYLYIQIHQNFYYDGINHLVRVLEYEPKPEKPTDYQVSDKSTGWRGDNHEFPTYEDAMMKGIELAFNILK
jgi:hypothetical protein